MSEYKTQRLKVAHLWLQQNTEDYAERESEAIVAIQNKHPGVRVTVKNPMHYRGEAEKCDALYSDGFLPDTVREKYGEIRAVSREKGTLLKATKVPSAKAAPKAPAKPKADEKADD